MPYLVDVAGTLLSTEAADALEDAFTRLATEATGFTEPAMAEISPFDALRARLDRRTIGISDWTHPNGAVVVGGGDWDRGEVETNLRQIEVIILALRTLVLRSATEVRVKPTQQSGFDAQGLLGAVPWVLEAFGGVNVKNNEKLAKDAQTLCTAPAGTRRFFACRPSAWPWRSSAQTLKTGQFSLLNDPQVDHVRLFEFTPSVGA